MIALCDGGNTDNSGIAHAIAAGATSITALVTWGTLKLLFCPEGRFSSYENYERATIPEAEFHCLDFKDMSGYKSARDKAEFLVDGFHQFGEGEYYKLKIGHMDVITRGNGWFGIPEGREVHLKLVM